MALRNAQARAIELGPKPVHALLRMMIPLRLFVPLWLRLRRREKEKAPGGGKLDSRCNRRLPELDEVSQLNHPQRLALLGSMMMDELHQIGGFLLICGGGLVLGNGFA